MSGQDPRKPEASHQGRRPVALAVLAGERGMALLLTLLLLAAMVPLTLLLHKRTAADQVAARAFAERQRLAAMAFGAVRLGQASLGLGGGADGADTLLAPWARLSGKDVAGLFGDAEIEVAIIDLTGRFPLNSLVDGGGSEVRPSARAEEARRVLLRLLASGDFAIAGEWEARQLVDALIDWLDQGERPEPAGAESSYYQGLDPPYGCRNGPLRSVEELLLVRGMSRELLFGTPTTRALADQVTIYGADARINLNTAPLSIIRALHPDLDGELLGRLDDYRRDPRRRDRLGDPGWYKNIGGWPADIVLYEDLLTTRSSYFQISATARQGVFARTASLEVERVGRSQLRLRWQKIQ